MSTSPSPYTEQYANPQGPNDGRPTGSQIIKDYGLENRFSGRVALVTGATSGIGLEAARAIHETGADIYIAALEATKAHNLIEDIKMSSKGTGKIELLDLDLGSLVSVNDVVRKFKSLSGTLNILITNAGIMTAPPGSRTKEGFDMRFGINHLGHYALTAQLLPLLIRSSTPDFNSRLVAITSSAHRFSSIRWDNLNLTQTDDVWTAYGQSKTANLWMANYIDRKYGPRGVHASAVNPGMIWTGILDNLDPVTSEHWKNDQSLMNIMQSPAQGSATTVWAAVSPTWEGKGGKYLVTCRIGEPLKDMNSIVDPGYATHAYDEEGENRLWELSSQLTGISVQET
ncbi:unnamed protein product [Clonostachys rosea]|uniref:Oxidoreductase n=1 Tax=Bionectria ochroleuca TaxID=29856 RepID=A0ABY6UYR2_BIOOC|nr:unnamed protein product [Clonostachys rosea]